MTQSKKTCADITAIIDNIKFEDREFRLLEKGDGFLFQVWYMEPDVETGKMERQMARKWYISPYATETEIIETVYAACQRSILHSLAERFTYKGRRIYSPHFHIEDRLEMCDRERYDRRD